MNKKMINSQIGNFKTYDMIFREMRTLAENVFEFKNLPNFIDVSYLNNNLLRLGSIAFFKDDVLDEVLALPFNLTGSKDMYGRPKSIVVFGSNGYRRELSNTKDKTEFVIMYDNNGRYPLYLDIAQMAERIAMCIRTQDINIKQQRTPRLWLVPKDLEKSVRDMMNEIDTMSEDVVGYKGIEINNIENVLSPAPYVTDKIDDHLDKLWAEFYRLIGVANLQEQKKERVIVDEMTATQGGTIASRFSRFEPRKRAIEKINELWNTNIEVQYYDGEPTTEEEKESEDVRDISDVSSDTKSTEA